MVCSVLKSEYVKIEKVGSYSKLDKKFTRADVNALNPKTIALLLNQAFRNYLRS